MSYYGVEFDRACKLLRESLPGPQPVKIHTVPAIVLERAWGVRTYGDATPLENYFLIRISRGLSRDLWLDCLAHEWGHYLDQSSESREPHRASWGAAYSRAYRVLFG